MVCPGLGALPSRSLKLGERPVITLSPYAQMLLGCNKEQRTRKAECLGPGSEGADSLL